MRKQLDHTSSTMTSDPAYSETVDIIDTVDCAVDLLDGVMLVANMVERVHQTPLVAIVIEVQRHLDNSRKLLDSLYERMKREHLYDASLRANGMFADQHETMKQSLQSTAAPAVEAPEFATHGTLVHRSAVECLDGIAEGRSLLAAAHQLCEGLVPGSEEAMGAVLLAVGRHMDASRRAAQTILDETRDDLGVQTLACVMPSGEKEASLSCVIQALYAGEQMFNAISSDDHSRYGGEDAVVEATYGPPWDTLQSWSQPARTQKDAIEALRLAKRELFDCAPNSPDQIEASMVAAALAYFEAAAV